MAFSRRTSNASREAALEASRLEAILSFTAARATHAPRKAFVGLLKESHLLTSVLQYPKFSTSFCFYFRFGGFLFYTSFAFPRRTALMIDYPHQTNLFQGIRLLCRLQGSVMYARGPQRPPVPRHSARHVPKLKSLASRRGSPRCLPLFFLSAALAMLFQDDRLFINRPIKELFSHPYAHQVFALSVGYGLVMRCNLAYNRWWEAMGHVRLMFSKFHDASTPRAAAVSAPCVPRRPARPVPKLTSLASGRGSGPVHRLRPPLRGRRATDGE